MGIENSASKLLIRLHDIMVDQLTVFQRMHNLVKTQLCKGVNKQNKVNRRGQAKLYKKVITLNQLMNYKDSFHQFRSCF